MLFLMSAHTHTLVKDLDNMHVPIDGDTGTHDYYVFLKLYREL
jgi:hypothetical protein